MMKFFNRIRFYMLLTTMCLTANLAMASGEFEYYLDISQFDGQGVVTLNGFDIFKHKGSKMVSTVVSQYLKSEDNRINYSFIPVDGRQIHSKIALKLVRVLKNEPLSSKNGTVILSEEMSNVWLRFSEINKLDSFEQKLGSISKDSSEIIFKKINHVNYWMCRLPGEARKRLPTLLKYNGIDGYMNNVEIHFFNSVTNKRVSFTGIKFDSFSKKLELNDDHLKSGSRFVGDFFYDSFMILGHSKSQKRVNIKQLKLGFLDGYLAGSRSFDAKSSIAYPWTDGVSTELLSDADKEQIENAVMKNHGAFSKKDLDLVKQLSTMIIKSSALMKGQEIDKVAAEQKAFYQKIFSTEGLVLQPIFPELLRFVALNDKVVRVEYVDGRDVLLFKKDNSGKSFIVPLRLSKIDNNWQLVP